MMLFGHIDDMEVDAKGTHDGRQVDTCLAGSPG
jgi:hypothetical protein